MDTTEPGRDRTGAPGEGEESGWETGGVDRREEGVTVIRSEEELEIGTLSRIRERVRIRKRVVTEEVMVPVTVRREELVVTREAATEAELGTQALDAPGEGDVIEVILSQERPVVGTETIPVERVRIVKERVTEERTVSEDLRREQIDIDQQPLP